MNYIDVGLAGQCGLGLLLIDDLDWEDRALVHRLERTLVKLEGEGGAGAGLVVVVTTRAGAAQLEKLLLDRCRTAGLQVCWNILMLQTGRQCAGAREVAAGGVAGRHRHRLPSSRHRAQEPSTTGRSSCRWC